MSNFFFIPSENAGVKGLAWDKVFLALLTTLVWLQQEEDEPAQCWGREEGARVCKASWAAERAPHAALPKGGLCLSAMTFFPPSTWKCAQRHKTCYKPHLVKVEGGPWQVLSLNRSDNACSGVLDAVICMQGNIFPPIKWPERFGLHWAKQWPCNSFSSEVEFEIADPENWS